MNLQIPTFLEPLLQAGLEITMSFKNDAVVYDLDLRSKSGLFLYETPGGWRVAMRYDEDFPVSSVEDLLVHAYHGMHGRDFINPVWREILKEAGYL